jgi:ferredoxin
MLISEIHDEIIRKTQDIPKGFGMKIKKVYAIYFSPTGTTQKAITAFVQGMAIPFETIDLTLPKDRHAFSRFFRNDELVVVGFPVYAGRLPMDLNDFFSRLQGQDTPAVAMVMYGNREYNDALIELRLLLEEKGFIVKAGAAFIGEHTFSEKVATGRPDRDDLALAADFGRKTVASIEADCPGELKLKGNYPFTWKGYHPSMHIENPPHPLLTTLESCTQCGLCAENCPWGAIDPNNCTIRDYSKCMICYRCLKNCPSKSIQVTGDKFAAYLPQFILRVNSQQKEPEIFLPE